MTDLDLGKVNSFTFKCKGYVIDKDNYRIDFTEKNVKKIIIEDEG